MIHYLPSIGERIREEEETEALEMALFDVLRMIEGRILTQKQRMLVDSAAERMWKS